MLSKRYRRGQVARVARALHRDRSTCSRGVASAADVPVGRQNLIAFAFAAGLSTFGVGRFSRFSFFFPSVVLLPSTAVHATRPGDFRSKISVASVRIFELPPRIAFFFFFGRSLVTRSRFLRNDLRTVFTRRDSTRYVTTAPPMTNVTNDECRRGQITPAIIGNRRRWRPDRLADCGEC